MAHDAHHDEIVGPKRLEVPSRYKMVTGGLALFGALLFVASLFYDPIVAWKGYIIGFWFSLGFGLFGPFFIATQHVTRAGWSVSLRRIGEAFGVFLLPAALFGLIGIVAIPDEVYLWKDVAAAAADPILSRKTDFLNVTGFAIATVASFAGWIAAFWAMRSYSLRQDDEGGYLLSNRMKAFSAIYLIAFTIGISFMSWYWLMSLEPNWFSTMFSVYAFAGVFQSGLALMYVVMISLGRRGYFGSFMGGRQVHDLGKMVFGFTVFYAYIGFCQFLLIWYANIPEEDVWYLQRLQHGWQYATLLLPFVKFIIPFLVMLQQRIKKNQSNIMYYLCIWLVGCQLYEIWYWVEPPPHGLVGAEHVYHHGFIEVMFHLVLEWGIAAGFFGLFGLVAAIALSRKNLIPIKDPYLHETLPAFTHEPVLMGGAYDEAMRATK